MADQIAGYPTSGLERFVTGFQSGWEKMTELRKKADDLEMQLAVNEDRRKMADASTKADAGSYSGGGDETTTTSSFKPDGTTGSGGAGGSGGGGGGGGGGGSVGDLSKTGDGHVATKEERLSYYDKINKENKWGLNMHAILQLVGSEGINKYVGDVTDPNGKSYGDFQLNEGGMGKAARAAGIDISDPNTWQQQGFYAMQQMAQHKNDPNWFNSQWHGPREKYPWAGQNYSNPNATPPSGMLSYIPPVPKPAAGPAIGSGSSTPPRVTSTDDWGQPSPATSTDDFGQPSPAPAANTLQTPAQQADMARARTAYDQAVAGTPASSAPAAPPPEPHPGGPISMTPGGVALPPGVRPHGPGMAGSVPAGTSGAGPAVTPAQARAANAGASGRLPNMSTEYVFGPGRAAPPGAGTVSGQAPAAIAPTPAAPVGIQSALPLNAKEQMVASALAERPTYAQLSQLVQQYLPAAKAALMPTGSSSGLYG